jgi:hypothetical protein
VSAAGEGDFWIGGQGLESLPPRVSPIEDTCETHRRAVREKRGLKVENRFVAFDREPGFHFGGFGHDLLEDSLGAFSPDLRWI